LHEFDERDDSLQCDDDRGVCVSGLHEFDERDDSLQCGENR